MLLFVAHMLRQIKAQQFYNDLGLYQLCQVLQKIVEFKDFSRHMSDFPVLFKADLVFKDFQESHLNSSTFQACANPAADNLCKQFGSRSGPSFCWS